MDIYNFTNKQRINKLTNRIFTKALGDELVIFRNDRCNGKEGAGQAVLFRDEDDIDMYLGPPCSTSTISAGLLASFWNMPMFSPASTDPMLSDKVKYSTLVRTSPAFFKMGAAILELFEHYNWTTTLIVSQRAVGTKDVFCDYSSRSIQEQFYTQGKPIPDLIEFDQRISEDDIDEILRKVLHRARIIIICGPAEDKKRFLLRANAAGMVNAEYLYISLNHLQPPNIQTPWVTGEEDDEVVRPLYRYVIESNLNDPLLSPTRSRSPYYHALQMLRL
ncbi:hypothetical protein CAPTEDRAFT_202251 [Capitella teleta]|uniref:Receptor ligand binding region domain-containing protein n=1 Tax=Capitella teleta TaxID=283909 RepID=R7V1U4_CAPTE|nr:hypothetical protein CAPTEDRAFT_202251 [Capitella teleta]|eukprot:ELU09641.1 hypothetical protein CAPTEDRAFT_202251 [Capitella teleta]